VSHFIALLDACVLYPAPLRDLLLRLAMSDLFCARWTDKIHDEWIKNLLGQRPDLTHEQLSRTRLLMNQCVPDCLVTGYAEFEAALYLPDPHDRHVLAAAIKCGASVIVTANLRDFPATELRKHEIDALHPDDFVCLLFEISATTVCAAVQQQRQQLKNPPKSVDELLEILRRLNMPKTVTALRERRELL
jgi:hypothetical protein